MKRGEVWWYERPEDKRRPVLLLTRDEAIDRLRELLVVPVTSTIRGIPTEEDGMHGPCALTLDNTFLARKALLTDRVAVLGPERMIAACRALQTATGC